MRSKKAIYTIISNLILQLAIVVYGFVVPRIIIEKFGSETNGLITSITQFLSYISLLEAGFGPVVKSVLYKPIARKNKDTIRNILKASESFFRKIAIAFIAYILILFVIYPLLIDESFEPTFTILLIAIIGASTFAEYYFGITYKLFLQAEQKTYISSIIQIITYILSTAVIIVLASAGANIFIIKLAAGLVFILRPMLQNVYVKKKYMINLKEDSSKYVIAQKWDGLAQHIAAVIYGNTDITVLTIFSTMTEVSVYSVYSIVVKGIKAITQVFSHGIDASFGDMIAKNETDNLNKKFSIYETAYNSLCTILFSCAIVLITPFIVVYSQGISDADYVRPAFGVLIAISEYLMAIRIPYSSITLAAGHFKQTRNGAWVECITNIIISIILVNWLGIVGVAIGTIVAMTIRTTEFIYHANKYILKRSIWKSAKKILLVIIETVIIVFLCSFLPYRENTDYLNCGINALMTFLVASVVVLGFNVIFFRKELSGIKSLFTSLLHRHKK